MSKLQSTIESLASDFATNVLAALRTASLADIEGITSGGRGGVARKPAAKVGGRLQRRSAGDLASMVEQIAVVLAKETAGLRAEQIRSALGVEAKELPRPL